VATATSVFIIFLSSFSGVITHMYLGDIHWPAVFLLGPGMIIGAIVGSWLSPRLNKRTLLFVFRIILGIVAAEFIFKGLTQ
jgi:uncharacterized membrane protein YfcA